MRAPTIHDVASRAGVHAATVSRALNRPEMVAPATRKAVLQAVEAIGFVPNRSARRLVSGRSDAIGVLVPDITNPYFGSIVQAVQRDARRSGMAVLIADTDARPEEERLALATLSRQVDGLIAVTPVTDLSAATIPVVQVNRRSHGVVGVVVDQEAIVKFAVEHLTGLGHRRIAIVRGPSPYWSAARRDRVLEKVMADDAIPRVRLEPLGPASPTFEGGRDLYPAVGRSGATAVVAFNDLQAAGILAGAQECGRSIPESLSVVGSDGAALSAMTAPPLTTVAAPLEHLGITARRRLEDLLSGIARPQNTTLSPSLVIRATTSPPVATRRISSQRKGRKDLVGKV